MALEQNWNLSSFPSVVENQPVTVSQSLIQSRTWTLEYSDISIILTISSDLGQRLVGLTSTRTDFKRVMSLSFTLHHLDSSRSSLLISVGNSQTKISPDFGLLRKCLEYKCLKECCNLKLELTLSGYEESDGLVTLNESLPLPQGGWQNFRYTFATPAP